LMTLLNLPQLQQRVYLGLRLPHQGNPTPVPTAAPENFSGWLCRPNNLHCQANAQAK
jgi:hypothetical protein